MRIPAGPPLRRALPEPTNRLYVGGRVPGASVASQGTPCTSGGGDVPRADGTTCRNVKSTAKGQERRAVVSVCRPRAQGERSTAQTPQAAAIGPE
jgi:hypothetical protein